MSKEIKNIVSDEIFKTYESIMNFLLGDQKRLEELAKIEECEEIKNAISGATTNVAKCLLDVLSFGLASSLLKAISGVVKSIKGNSNETERLLSVYDKIAKQYNKQNKAEIKKGDKIKLQTSDEMLNDIYKDSGMKRRQFRLLKNSMTRNFMQISLMKQKQRVDMLDGKLKCIEGRLQVLEKQIQQQNDKEITQTPQKEDKGVQVQSLSDRFKGLERFELSETNDAKDEQVQTPHATETSNEKVQTQQQKDKKAKIRQFHDLPDRLKNIERIKLPKRNDLIKEEEIQISLKSQSLDSGIAHLRDKNKRFKGANKEIKERTHQNDLASVSMLVN